MEHTLEIPAALLPIIENLRSGGVRPVIVGGYVRDALLGAPSKDIDIECFGIGSPEALVPLLAPFGSVNSVGKSFGVLKLETGGLSLDFSLPRTEIKSGRGHTGFDVTPFERFDFKTAARRRDFTVNAIGYDPVQNALLDPYGGRDDLERGRLRCVDPVTFVEDPLRLLRAVQFAARFTLTPDKQLLTLAQTMMQKNVLAELPKERLFEEFKKLLLKADAPSFGFRTMDALHVTPFFPALLALKGVPIDPSNHKEGDVWTHTLMAVDAMAALRGSTPADPLALMLGILCHDMGKPLTTRLEHGRIKAPGHAVTGLPVAASFLAQLTDDKRLTATVLDYVRYHGEAKRLFTLHASDAEILRLAGRVSIDAIAAVATADHLGRLPRVGHSEAAAWLRAKAENLGVLHAPKPALLGGNDLIAAGLPPSPQFKTLLEEAYEAQLEGAFADRTGARKWLVRYLSDLGKS
jgi:tRNA nucleotidyltransferase (CCA-adding enzyme)